MTNTPPAVRYHIRSMMKMTEAKEGHVYLGLPVEWKGSKIKGLDVLKQRVFRRISSWKGAFLSQAGTEVMIKSVIAAIPAYTMSYFLLPKTFCEWLD